MFIKFIMIANNLDILMGRNWPLYWIIILFIYCNYQVAYSQRTDEPVRIYDLDDTIVVIADRYKIPLKELSFTHEIIPGKIVYEMSKHSALEIIDIAFPSAYTMDKKIIGYGVGREGAGSVTIRGQGGKPNTGMLVLLNGHPDFMGLFGHPLPDVFGMDDVQKVEILAGPASSVFGSQALGGVINIKSGPDYDNPLKVSMEAGSFTTYNFGLNLSTQIKQHGIFFTFRHKHTDGHIAQSSFESSHIQTGWQYQLDPQWKISLQGRYVPYEFDDPIREGDPANLGTYAKIKRGNGELILSNNGDEFSGSAQIYGNWGKHKFYDGFSSTDFAYGLSVYQQWNSSKKLNIAFGGDLIFYGGKAKNEIIPPGIVNEESHTINSAGAYSLAMYNPFDDLSLKLGLRYQYNSLITKKISPVAGFNYSILSTLKFYANFQTGFRFPTVNELYLFPNSNPDLKEEDIKSIESGLWFYWSAKAVMRLTVYKNEIKNYIQNLLNPASPPLSYYTNSENVSQMGVETQINFQLMHGVDVQFSYSFLEPGRLTAFNPKHQLKYMIIFESGRFKVNLFGKYIDHFYADNDQNPESRLSDYNLTNLILFYSLNQWNLRLRFFNLFDRSYIVDRRNGGSYVYNAPGFHILAGLEYKL